MSHPALVPAIALVAGAWIGCLRPSAGGPAAWVCLGAGVAVALWGYCTNRSAALLGAAGAGFAAGALLLAAGAATRARHPSLERFVSEEGNAFVLEGRLRQDAWPMESAVGLRLEISAVERDGVRHPAKGGVSLTVGGELALAQHHEWTAGRRLRMPATLREPAFNLDPGVPDRRDGLADRGTRYVGSVKSGALVEVVAPGTAADETTARARRAVRRAIDVAVGRWSAQSAAIVVAILIGDRAGLGAEVERRLQEAGTYHVIAISGGNIAILAGLLLAVARLAGGASRWRYLLASGALIGYGVLVGGSPSVVRATIMAVTCLVALAADHRTPSVNALAVAAGLVMVAAPLTVRDPGFPLSFGATAGILLGVARAGRRLPRAAWARLPAALFLASLSAELALLPVAACAFSRVTFAGLVLNFLAIPLMSVAQVAGVATLALAVASDPLAAAAGWMAHVGAWGLVASARFVDVAPWTAFRVPPPPIAIIVGYYLGWTGWFGGPVWLAARARGRLARPVRQGSLALVAVCTCWIVFSPAGRNRGALPDGRLTVTFLDVGQADAILVRLPDARTLLVDTGGSRTGNFDVGGRVILPALWALDVYRLDVLVITHGDPDHIGGAGVLVHDFRIGEIWDGVPVPPDATVAAVRQQADRRGVLWRTVTAGERFTFGDVTLDVLHPPPPDWERQKVRNDDSIVLDVRYGDVSVLLTGDIGLEVEREIATRLEPAPLRVLKVPHHGSAGSSSPDFLAAARAALAVFTIGRERHMAAFEGVLRRYRDAGIPVFRTDRDGAVTVSTDGSAITVGTFNGQTTKLTKNRGDPGIIRRP